MREPIVIEFVAQQADNGWVVSTRKAGQDLALHIEADEVKVSERIASELAKHKRPEVVTPQGAVR